MHSGTDGFFSALFSAIEKRPLLFFSCMILLSIGMHFHIFKLDLVGVHVWRQSQTQINIQNFAFTDFNILNPKSYSLHNKDFLIRYEFPLMQWIFACVYRLFGEHVIISRILTFLIGVLSLTGMYKLLTVLFNNARISIAGAWAFCFSPVFYYYTVNPLPDNFALCLSIWSLFYFFRHLREGSRSTMLLSFLFLALATLCKLPFLLYGFPWVIRFLLQLRKKTLPTLLQGIVLLLFLLPAVCWYAWVIPDWIGNGIVQGMMGDEGTSISRLMEILLANLASTLPELLLNYGSVLFFIAGFVALFRFRLYRTEKGMYLSFLGLAVIAYFLFEMNMIGTVHDYYLFPFLPLLFILVAYGCRQVFLSKSAIVKGIGLLCLLILPLTAFLRIDNRWNTEDPGFNKDLYTYKNELRNTIPDNALCISGNDPSSHIWPYYLHRKCWCFHEDRIDELYFNSYCREGAAYLITDSRKVEALPFVQAHIKRLVTEKGSIRVYELY